MFIGHYGVAFAARGLEKRIPLWAYFIAVQWVDILWCVLVYFGVERVSIHPGINPSGPLVFDYYPYTHSLLAGIAWAAVAFAVYRLATAVKGSRAAAGMLALAVFSHWILDFIVHQPDLDLIGESHKVGLGLWNYPVTELAVESALVLGGLLIYFKQSPELTRGRRFAVVLLCALIAGVQLAGSFGPPPPSLGLMAISGFALYLAFALWAFFAEARRKATA